MFIRVKSSPNSPRKTVQIVENYREEGKVKQRIVQHMGVIQNDEHEIFLRELAQYAKAKLEAGMAQGQMFTPEEMVKFVIDGHELSQKQKEANDQEQSLPVDLKNLREEQRITVGIHEVYGSIYDELNLQDIMETPDTHKVSSQILKDITLARIANPQSKKASVHNLENNYGLQINLSSVYKMMDLIDESAIERLKDTAKKWATTLFGEEIKILYYDCTTLYFESFEEDELRKKGFSKEHRVNETQIVLALAVTQEGIPVDYEVFSGSTNEGTTMETVLTRLKARWDQSTIRLVADSALMNQKNMQWLQDNRIEYILGAKPKSHKAAVKEQILKWADNLNKTQKAHTVIVLENGHNMHVSFDPKRAQKDSKDRQRALEKLKKKCAQNKSAKTFMSGGSAKKYLQLVNESKIEISEEKIREAERWDGVHAVITSVKELGSEEVFNFYHGLWQVEETFRISKHDLAMRPIFHYKSLRIHAHIAICFMALLCVRYLEYRVKIQKPKLSPLKIREALVATQISVVKDISTNNFYAIPSMPTPEAKQLYSIVNKTLSNIPFSLGKLKR